MLFISTFMPYHVVQRHQLLQTAFQFFFLRNKFRLFVVLPTTLRQSFICLSACKVDKISFDDIIDNVGGFGSWQMVIFFMVSSFDVFAAFSLMLPVFTGKTLCAYIFFKKSVIRLRYDCIGHERYGKLLRLFSTTYTSQYI